MQRKSFLRWLGVGSLGLASGVLIDRHLRPVEAPDSGPVNVTMSGAAGDGATNDAPAIQSALGMLPGGRGALYFPAGTYLCTSDVHYALDSRSEGGTILLQGDGLDRTILHFDGADFTDNSSIFQTWDTGWTRLIAVDMTFKFYGDYATGKGTWKGQTTLPHMKNVRLRTGGYYNYTTGNTVLDLGSAPEPVRETCVWQNVFYEPHAEGGTSINFLRIHHDTFLWLGGGIYADYSSAVNDPRLFDLRPVYASLFDSLSDFVPSETTNPALYALVAISDQQGQIIFRNCHIGNYSAHFKTDSSITPMINLIGCSSEKWPLILSKTQGAYSLPIIKYDNNRGRINKNGGTISVAHGGPIAHGLASTPTQYGVTATVAGHVVTVTGVDSTTLTIGLTDSHGHPVTSPETVAWWAEF
jgi:Pectate lyase superfamily protein